MMNGGAGGCVKEGSATWDCTTWHWYRQIRHATWISTRMRHAKSWRDGQDPSKPLRRALVRRMHGHRQIAVNEARPLLVYRRGLARPVPVATEVATKTDGRGGS